ncbi:MAG: Rpn family recombination-promoting nuclease/putative transposase, partial [Candidatus Brocadiae bacterium]|nr:Rpn family recombination-promoting nuclease/putative transposase [Candidatus Brocadiia bacterium]
MCTVNPKVDIIFRKLFGSEENKDILLSLVNAVVQWETPIQEIIIKNPYNFQDYIRSKASIVDIKGVDEKGRWYDIELQVGEQGFYGRRALFYLCKLFASQLESGDTYSKLMPTIGIHFLDFDYFPNEKRYRRRCVILD